MHCRTYLLHQSSQFPWNSGGNLDSASALQCLCVPLYILSHDCLERKTAYCLGHAAGIAGRTFDGLKIVTNGLIMECDEHEVFPEKLIEFPYTPIDRKYFLVSL